MNDKTQVITDALFSALITSTLKKEVPTSGISIEAARRPAPQLPTNVKINDRQSAQNTKTTELPKKARLSSLDIKIGYTETPESHAHVHHGLSTENIPLIRATQLSLRF